MTTLDLYLVESSFIRRLSCICLIAMAEKTAPHNQQQLHVFFFPFMSPGHQIPMLDMARLVATRGVKTTIVTTPCNFSRFQSIIDRDRQSGNVDINVHILKFPSDTAGLPQNCENLALLPLSAMSTSFSLHSETGPTVHIFLPLIFL